MPGQYSAPIEEESANNIRYGRIPQHVPRRFKTLKRVECVCYSTCFGMSLADPFRSNTLVQAGSFHGNTVLDSAIPTKLLNLCIHKDDTSSLTCAILPRLVTRMTQNIANSTCLEHRYCI